MLDRRGFLKFIGGAAVGTLATPVIWKGLDDISIWTQNWPWVPKLEYGNNDNTYIRTVSKISPAAEGTRIRLVGDRPVRVLGDVEHPLSGGGVSALAAAEVQLRYSPARLKRPLKKAPDGAFVSISWNEAEDLLARECEKCKNRSDFVCISGDENGSMNELFSGFAAHLGSDRFFLMPGDAQPAAAAWEIMGGKGRAGYDFPRSDFILAIGANVLETWGPVVGNRRAWGDARPLQGEPAMRLAYAGPVQNNTAAGADVWLPIKPGTELFLALGLANLLLAAGKNPIAPDLEPFRALAAAWTPEKTSLITGLPAAKLAEIRDLLLKAERPLVIAGSELDQGGGAAPIMAGIALNMLLDRINKDGGLRALPVSDPLVPRGFSYASLMRGDLGAYVASVNSGRQAGPRVLMVYEANPVYALPDAAATDALFKKAAFSVSFSCFLDETAQLCDLVIPSALGLERFDDVAYPYGVGETVYSLARPVAEPLFESRPAGETLLNVASALNIDLGFSDVPALLRAKAEALGADWEALMEGRAHTDRRTVDVLLAFRPDVLGKAAEAVPEALPDGGLRLATVTRLSLGTAETAIPPFNTKTITQGELARNMLVARINGATARELGLRDGRAIVLSNASGAVRALVRIYEGVTDRTVALTTGFGHTAFDVYNEGKGMNVMRLFEVTPEPGTGLAVWRSPALKAVKA